MANSTADGSVVIDVNMDVSQAEKRLGKLRDNIKKTEKEIADATAARDEAQKKLDNSPLEQEQKKLQDMMDARKKAAEVESSLVPISKEISALELLIGGVPGRSYETHWQHFSKSSAQ